MGGTTPLTDQVAEIEQISIVRQTPGGNDGLQYTSLL